jgi:VanZ family protein
MRDITQEYSSLTEYAVRVLDIVVIFALAHSAALLRLSIPLHTLSNSHLIVTYFCAALALPMLPRFEFRMLSHNHPFAVTFCQMSILSFHSITGSRIVRTIFSLLLIASLGLIDEGIQYFLPYRNASLTDWCFDNYVCFQCDDQPEY